MNDIKERVARGLLAIGAVFLRPEEPFTWASGIKSPIYCDNRLILTAPDVRNEVEAAIAETVRREFPEAEGYIPAQSVPGLMAFRADPSDESWMGGKK